MRLIPPKINGDTVQDFEWNPAQQEIQNAVTDTGQTLDANDNYQLSKTVSNYVSSGDYYLDSGSANAYVLSPIGSKKTPTSYIDGLRLRFIPANNNTSTTTISISGLSTKNLKKGNINTVLANLQLNDIVSGYITEAIYFAGLDCFVLSPSNYTQIVSVAQIPTGSVMPMIYNSNNVSGWVIMNNGTIGDASSGATNRANSDCQNLFITLWGQVGDTYAPVSGGRGSSALNDWNAHKRIQLLDSLGGKFIANAFGIYGMGQTGGASAVSLSSTNNGQHDHVVTVQGASGAGGAAGFQGGSTTTNPQVVTSAKSGNGSSFPILPPFFALNFFMKL